MTKIGRKCILEIIKMRDQGIYLDGGDDGEILLPKRYVPEGVQIGDTIEVFIYRDSEDRIIATTETPRAEVGECALLKCTAVTDVGAFLDWGLSKDLFVPFAHQKIRMEEDRSYIVYLFLDDKDRITASSRLGTFFGDTPPKYFEVGKEVKLLIHSKSDLGYMAIIDDCYWGMIFDADAVMPLRKGKRMSGFIKNIRPDGKVDLSLHKPGYQKADAVSELILAALKKHNGFINVTDKTPPEVIYKQFGVSKKAFKRTLGVLYKKRIIAIEDNGVRLLTAQE